MTHPAIRWEAGQWVRDAVLRWHLDHPEPADLLIGEAPLVGNRFVELAQPREDRAEDLLRGEVTEFFVPVPSVAVRRGIQRSREQEMRQPRHEQERANAPVRLPDELLPVEASAQELGTVAGELIPSQEKALQLLSEVDSCEPGELERAVLNWFRI